MSTVTPQKSGTRGWHAVRTEAVSLTLLALPVVIDQVGIMSMGVVDTIMVGGLGKTALSAVGMSTAIYYFFMVFAYGLISAVTPTVAQALGRGDREEITRSTGQAFWLALALWVVGMAIMLNIEPLLHLLDQPPEAIPDAALYTRALSIGMLPNLLYSVLRAYTTGLGRTRVTMVIALAASAVNAGVVYLFVYGGWGIPAMGVKGAGYATAIAQTLMFILALVAVRIDRELWGYRVFAALRPFDRTMIARLARLGSPIGAGNSMEQGVFALTLLLMGQFGDLPQGAHQVAINVAATTFMISLGISQATTTRVGFAIGQGRRRRATLSGWVGIGMAVCVTLCTAVLFLLLARPLADIYVENDPGLLEYAALLLMIAGAFQVVDGIQVTAQGALRGMKDTVYPMTVNLISYWVVGLPLGCVMAFVLGMEGPGLWWGLTIGLAVAALLHTLRFRRLTVGAVD